MSKKRIIQAVVGPDLVFFAVRPLELWETVVDGWARMNSPFTNFANATHFDILLSLYRCREVRFQGWSTVFAVNDDCRFALARPNRGFAVWGLRVRDADIQAYNEAIIPYGRCGILVVIRSEPIKSRGLFVRSTPGYRSSGPSRP